MRRGPAAALALGATLLIAALIAGRQSHPERGPVFLIVLDTLRADHLSQYGYDLETSPALAQLTARSTRFEAAYAPTSWTRASVSSLMTGMSPLRHGVGRSERLAGGAWTLAEAFAGAGWRTGGFSLNPNVSDQTGLDQGFEDFPALWRSRAVGYRHAAAGTRAALDWLDEGSADAFVFLLLMNAHGPYRVPRGRESTLLGRPPTTGFAYYGSIMDQVMRGGRASRRQAVGPRTLQSLNEQYDTAIRYTTDTVGSLLGALEERGLYDRSTIVLTSDHGEELFDHGGFSHGYSLYDEVLHVPLWIKLPGQREAAVVRDRVSLLDIFPTLAAVHDLEPPPAADGRSLLPLIGGEHREERAELYSIDWPGRCVASALVRWPWKLIQVESSYEGLRDATLLYDLSADPGEREDRAGAEPERVADMGEELAERGRALRDGRWSEPAEREEGFEERLRALGYVE